MNPVVLPYNLTAVSFSDLESKILGSIKLEFEKFGINAHDDIFKKEYQNFFRYYTLKIVCGYYNEIKNKKSTILFVEEECISQDILSAVKEISKILPIPIFITKDRYVTLLDKNTAEYKDLTIRIKEYRYSIDYSKYSFNKINRFYRKHGLDMLLDGIKIA